MLLRDLIDEFLHYKEIYCSMKSVSDYRLNLYRFLRFSGNIDTSGVSEAMLQEYISYLKKDKLSDASIESYWRDLKIFIRWCNEEYEKTIFDVRLKRIRTKKVYQKQVPIYSNDEIKELFNNVSAENEWLTIRNKLMIALMYDSGLRQGEVVNLENRNIFESDKRMLVCGKGNKERYVPIGSASLSLLRQYRMLCPYSNTYLFVTRRGEHITNNTIKLMMQKLKKKVGFPVSSHMLRHNFATNYCLDQLRKTGVADPHSLALIMGHEELTTTLRYVHDAEKIYAAERYVSHLDSIAI